MARKGCPLNEQLEAWGRATATRFAANEDGPSIGDSPLARQRELGMRHRLKREKEHQIVPRDGGDRRRYMAGKIAQQSDGKLKLAIVPMWAVDPVRGRNDADPPRDLPRAQIDLGIPEELMWVERAYSQLERQHPMRAKCFYEEFATPGSQEAKAKRIADRFYGGKFSKEQYRRELFKAITYVDSKRAA